MVIGNPGGGKTTLAATLGRALGLAVFHTDGIFWQPDGSRRPKAQVPVEIRRVSTLDAFIFEASYGQTHAERLAACDVLIWLDPPEVRRCLRIWRRMCRSAAGSQFNQPVLPKKPETGAVDAVPAACIG